MRSPSRDDATIARICWKLSKILESDILAGKDATELRTRAEIAKRDVVGRGEGEDPAKFHPDVQVLDDDGNIENVEEREEESYNALVPLFYR